MEQEVLEYFEEYFGGQLNESTSDEDIMEAVYDLIDLTEAVLEAVMGGWDTPRRKGSKLRHPLHKGSWDDKKSDKKSYAKMTPDERFADSSRRKDAMRQELMKKYEQDK